MRRALAPVYFSILFGGILAGHACWALDYQLVNARFGYDSSADAMIPTKKSGQTARQLLDAMDTVLNDTTGAKGLKVVAGNKPFFVECTPSVDSSDVKKPRNVVTCDLQVVSTGVDETLGSNAVVSFSGHLAKAMFQSLVKSGRISYTNEGTVLTAANVNCLKSPNAEATISCGITNLTLEVVPLEDAFKNKDEVSQILAELGLPANP